MCRALEVSVSGCYAWRKREPSRQCRADAELAHKIKGAFQNNRCVYGSPRIPGSSCKRKGFMVLANGSLVSCERWSWWQNVRAILPATTKSEEGASVAPNLLQQDFHADPPNQKWTTDTTYIWTQEGWLYLAVVLDLFSRMVVGWAMAAIQDAALVINARAMALARRRPPAGLLHHSDRGST